MRIRKDTILLLLLGLLFGSQAQAALYITIVEGLGGMPEYADKFEAQREQVAEASRALNNDQRVTVFSGEEATREAIMGHLDELAGSMTDDDRLALYLIGHGSFDGDEYKFNIPGLDLSTADLQESLAALPGRNHLLVNTSSTSGALLEPLASDNRIIITATRNGNERNATEFGEYFARALGNQDADLNKNGYISVQEAFDFAEREVAAFYEEAGKLATEHPQLQGDNAPSFNLARLGPPVVETDNEALNALLEERRAVDEEIEALQLRRDELSDEEYTRELRALVLESAELSEQIEALNEDNGDN